MDENLTYLIITKKSVERIKILVKNKEEKKDLEFIIGDLSELILNLRKGKVIEKNILEFFQDLMSNFYEVNLLDADWYRKSKHFD